MANTKTILGFIAGAAIGAIACILAHHESSTTIPKDIAGRPGDWKANTTDNFTGWLERLQQGIGKEIKNETL